MKDYYLLRKFLSLIIPKLSTLTLEIIADYTDAELMDRSIRENEHEESRRGI